MNKETCFSNDTMALMKGRLDSTYNSTRASSDTVEIFTITIVKSVIFHSFPLLLWSMSSSVDNGPSPHF